MRITWKYTATVNGAEKSRSYVLGDDGAGLPIFNYLGPKMGVTVDRVQAARAATQKIFVRGNQVLDGQFTVHRTFGTSPLMNEWRHEHWAIFQGAGELVMEDGSWRATAPVAAIFAAEPVTVRGIGLDVTYYYTTEGFQ